VKKLFAFLCVAFFLAGCVTAKPDPNITRDIPLSLFTGMMEGETKKIHPHYDGNPITVTGPVEWKHPVSGETLTGYWRERISGSSGQVDQFFVARKDGQGIGRAWDSRWKKIDFTGEAKFPLGVWYQGETRTITGHNTKAEITTENLNQGGDGGLTYTWRAFGECWRYTYKPNVGLTTAQRNC